MRNAAGLLAGLLVVVAALIAPAPVWALPAALEEPPDSLGFSSSSAQITAALPDWLEPRGLNIVDLVGWVPESYLAGAIIQYAPGYGILRYVSGSRVGATVTITATAYPRFYNGPEWNGSLFGCLGQTAHIDELGSVAPATKLRVYAPNGQEVTRQVDGYTYAPAGLRQPIRSPHEAQLTNQPRYEETDLLAANIAADGALLLPANMGCELLISGKDYRELTLVFEAEVTPVVSVTVLGAQVFQFPVYFGVGYAGHLDALRIQLAGTCTSPPPTVANMVVPSGADYFLFNYPPASVDPYTVFPYNPLGNIDRPTGSTYRIRTARGLSVDHVISAALPLSAHWVDMDLAPGAQYLPYTRQVVSFEGLEPLLPAGIPYDPCMVYGNCSPAKLAEICHTAVSARMIYLHVERIRAGLSRIPLQMPGPAWSASGGLAISEAGSKMTPAPGESTHSGGAAAAASVARYKVYLALVMSQDSLEPDDLTGCSANGGCGWFTSDGRMVDYVFKP